MSGFRTQPSGLQDSRQRILSAGRMVLGIFCERYCMPPSGWLGRCLNNGRPMARIAQHHIQALRVLMCLSALFLMSCASWMQKVRDYGRSAAAGVGDELPNMKEPLKRILRESLLQDDTIKQVAARASEGAFDAVERKLADAEVQRRLDGIVTQVLKTLEERGTEATRALLRVAGPELKDALRAAVAQTVTAAGTALKESLEKDLTKASEQLARSTAETLVATLVQALDGPLGKRLEQTAGQMAQQIVGQATGALRDPSSKAAVSEFTESAMRGAVRGTRDAVSESLPSRLQSGLIAGTVVLGVLLLLCILATAVVWNRYKMSTTTLAIIAEKINQHEASELKRAIHKSATDNYVGPWLSTFLKARGL